ncbi:MAG: hypothetical protein C0507_06495 [Cyanobacteria bacterium PR.3.49]|nr:hypothetical protein [Cyanobacteria bacterium PR.3.49]
MSEETSSQDAKTIRLIKHPRPPAEAQIEELLTTARKNLRITVELPFAESGEPYMLSSFIESAKAECFWMFYRGVGPDSTLLWNMLTDDPGLIHHLMTAEFPALETGFSVPKSPAVARAVANYKDAHDAQLPADSEFEMSDTPAAANFPKSAKPEHDLLTLPEDPKNVRRQPEPQLQSAQQMQSVPPAPQHGHMPAPINNASPQPAPFPQAQPHQPAGQPAFLAQAPAFLQSQNPVQPAQMPPPAQPLQTSQEQQASPPQMVQAPFSGPAPALPPALSAAQVQPHHQNLEPPPGYTPLHLPQGLHLAHSPQAPSGAPVVPEAPAQAGFAPPDVPVRGGDKTLKLDREESSAAAKPPPSHTWLKDDRGTSMVVEPVAPELDSPFVQPKKPKATQQKMKARPMLEGDLTNLQMPTLLQSINMGKMTGRLDLQSGSDVATIYFKEGNPLHCDLRNSEGETAIVEAIGWDEGEFRFFAESPHHRDTIKKRLDLLLMEGAALIDQSKFLKEIGINTDSYLVRNHSDITEALFEEMVSRGAAADMNLQKMLYQLIDNESTLEDLLRLRPMPKPRWVPVIFNLVTCSLVSFSDRPLREGVEEAAAENIDWPAIQAFEDSIRIAETGFLSYPAFFYHLEREYERFERFQRPFSLIILEISIKEDLSETKDPKVLQDRAVLGQVSTRVDKLKRKTDIAGHFGENQFALLLLETEGDAARNFASRLAEAIAMNPFTTDRVEVVRLTVSLGVASVPETCRDLGRLISAARPQNSQKG